MTTRRALVTGVTGQDGSYLVELLLAKGYEVHGLVRRSSTSNLSRVAHVADRLRLHDGDLSAASIAHVLRVAAPDEVYHLAAMSHVGTSFAIPDVTVDVTGLGAVRLLEAIRQGGARPRFYFAATSELFGAAPPPQSEATPFQPRSPYAVAKLLGYWATACYRNAYGLHASSGILYNHESPRRGEDFVTRKVTLAAARIKRGLQERLLLGNLDARRDWGFAADYVEAMWRMLQQEHPDDYVIATGEEHTVREFVEEVFAWHDLDWRRYVEVDAALRRPAEVDALRGDASKAARVLGWRPTVRFKQLARMMAAADDQLVDGSQVVVS